MKLSKIINLEKLEQIFLDSLEIYYSKEKQKNFWVIGMEFKIK